MITKYISETTYRIYKIMNNLRRKLQFFTSVGGAKLTVLLPIKNQSINTDEEFYCEVELPQNIEADFVEVRFNQYLLGTLEVALNNIASGYITIPNRLVGFGTTFIVEDGQEVPVNDTVKQTLLFKVKKISGKATIMLTASKDYYFGNAKNTVDLIDEENKFVFGNCNIELFASDNYNNL